MRIRIRQYGKGWIVWDDDAPSQFMFGDSVLEALGRWASTHQRRLGWTVDMKREMAKVSDHGHPIG